MIDLTFTGRKLQARHALSSDKKLLKPTINSRSRECSSFGYILMYVLCYAYNNFYSG